jgi:transposase
MRRLEIENAEATRLALQQEIARTEEARYDHRLHSLLLISQGFSCSDAAAMFGDSVRTVENWVRRFQQNGLAGLHEGERPGRPPKLDDAIRGQLERDLRCDPPNLGYDQNLWDGKLLSFHLQKAYGITIGVRQCQRLFHEFGFRLRKPRPVLAKADPQAQAEYKKN